MIMSIVEAMTAVLRLGRLPAPAMIPAQDGTSHVSHMLTSVRLTDLVQHAGIDVQERATMAA